MARCPDCDVEITHRKKLRLGQLIECQECGAELEVISLDPFELDYYLGDDDWDEDENY